MSACPACLSHNIIHEKLNFSRFRHFDFTPIYVGESRISQCTACGMIINDDDRVAEIVAHSNKLTTIEYAQSSQSNQKKFTSKPSGETRSKQQARLLSKLVKDGWPRILDFGCFDGTLLRELISLIPGAECVGYDINPHLSLYFENKSGPQFLTGDVSELEGGFDLIVSSHSIFYEIEIHKTIHDLIDLLSDNGILYIQTPDIESNPLQLSMGDCFYYFSQVSLENMLVSHGLNLIPGVNDLFPREAFAIGQKSNFNKNRKQQISIPIEKLLDRIDSIRTNILAYASFRPAILGTTTNAVFAQSVLGNSAAFFVDEDTAKIGEKLNGLDVFHPSEIDEQIPILLPYGPSSYGIRKSLAARYNKKFVDISW